MQKNRNLIVIVILSILIICLACSNKKPAPLEEWDNQYPPVFVHKSIEIPEMLRQNLDSMAQILVGYVDTFNETEKYVPLLNPSSDTSLSEYTITEFGPPWVESWKSNEGFLILLIIYGNDERHDWELKFWGQDSVNNKFYDKWIVLTAYNDFEGNSGSIVLYDENSKDRYSDYSWYTYPLSSQYYRSFQMTSYKENASDMVEMNLNYDRSGVFTLYGSQEEKIYIEYRGSWNLYGQGEWTHYNEKWEIIDSGNW